MEDKYKRIQNKYNFSDANTFEKLKKTYTNMIRDKEVTKSDLRHEYDTMKESGEWRFYNEEDPWKSKRQILKIIEKEMKYRGMNIKKG